MSSRDNFEQNPTNFGYACQSEILTDASGRKYASGCSYRHCTGNGTHPCSNVAFNTAIANQENAAKSNLAALSQMNADRAAAAAAAASHAKVEQQATASWKSVQERSSREIEEKRLAKFGTYEAPPGAFEDLGGLVDTPEQE